MNIDWTDEALTQAIKRVESRGSAGIRIALLGGGCSGFKYDFNYADGPKSEQDIELDFGKFKMWVCPMSEMYLDGIVIGWEVDGLNEQFTFWNPMQQNSCGCVESVGF